MTDEPETSDDAVVDALDDAVDALCKQLGEIEKQLRVIATTLDKMREATIQQIALTMRVQSDVARGATAKNAGTLYESGHGPRRSGDTYGIVAAQPATETSPEPPVHADHPPGHLRSSDEC
jgi:hypothetical protein